MKLIDKDALLAEIENLLDKGRYHEEYDCAYRDGNNGALYALKNKLDTLEVKEVDLCKEEERIWKDFNMGECHLSKNDLENIAKHFYELGLKAQHDNWKVENLWKPADGEDLPIFDREVIALEGIVDPTATDCFCGYKVVFAHRPTPEGYNGKSITTGVVEHYTPETYGEGGWNVPNIAYWLDIELPKEIEL